MPRVLVRMRRAVRRLALRSGRVEPSGAENQARWQAMLAELEREDREAERRLEALEQALNAGARH